MGFGATFRAVVATLHSGATATFLLQTLSREIPVEFLVRQADPLAALLFNIQLEPFLSVLHRLLPGLAVGDVQELVEAYMADVDMVGSCWRKSSTLMGSPGALRPSWDRS